MLDKDCTPINTCLSNTENMRIRIWPMHSKESIDYICKTYNIENGFLVLSMAGGGNTYINTNNILIFEKLCDGGTDGIK